KIDSEGRVRRRPRPGAARDPARGRSEGNETVTPATNGSTDLTAKILLVDQESTLFELEGILQDLGPELVRAATHQEAVRHLSEDDFAVVILDLQAPGVDGFETARAIRSRERSRQTPVIFLAEGDRPEFPVVKAYALGAVDYLHKPLMPEVLRAKVAGFVDLFQKTQQVNRQAEQL